MSNPTVSSFPLRGYAPRRGKGSASAELLPNFGFGDRFMNQFERLFGQPLKRFNLDNSSQLALAITPPPPPPPPHHHRLYRGYTPSC